MKLIDLKPNGEVVISPLIKAFLFIYVGVAMAHISLKSNDDNPFGFITIIVISALAGAFMTYGILVFINDVRKTKTFKDLINRIKKNIND
jgi:hypothetical protein